MTRRAKPDAERAPVRRIFVVVSRDGYLCDLADTRGVAQDMTTECPQGHGEPHRVESYIRAAVLKGKP